MGCLSALAMAPVYAWPLMMLGYSTLFYYLLKADTWKRTGTYAFPFFFGYFLSSLYWVSSSLFVDLDRWWWALPLSFIGLPLLLSLFPLILFSFIGVIARFFSVINKINKTIIIIMMLIIIDLARGHIFTGFPWNMPAHTWTHTPVMMGSLPFIGFYGLSALTIILFIVPVLLLFKSKIAAVAFIAIFTAVTFLPIAPVTPEKRFLDNIIMIQANIPQDEKWNREYIERNIDRYLSMSRQAVDNAPEKSLLIFWPETAISDYLYNHPPFRNRIDEFLQDLPEGSRLITGYLHQTNNGYYNGLAVLSANALPNMLYNKHHLVPFGEYMPFGIDTITSFTGLKNGSKPKSIKIADQSFLPLICYEIIFPHYAARSHNNDILLNLTNDAWFGNTAGPYQHFDHAVFRAVENDIPVIRLSGNGISAIITNHGRIITNSKLNEQKTMTNF